MFYYLFVMLDSIIGLFAFLMTISAIALFITFEIMASGNISDEKGTKIGRISLFSFITFLLLTIFTPNQKQLAFIITAPAIIENKDLQEVVKNTPEIMRLGTEYLKEILSKSSESLNETQK